MNQSLSVLICVALLFSTVAHAQTTQASAMNKPEQFSLDRGWLFHLGDIPFPVISGQDASYNNAKAGKAWGAAAMEYDDAGWRTLDLPHDWAVEGPFDPNANGSQGYRPRGFGWYRRWFALEESDRGKHLELQFDGVSTHCTVWVNGILAARNFCGYTGFNIDITPFARFGKEQNYIAVRVDAEPQEGWWYEGAGIYRHTWLIKQNSVHIVTDGVFAQPVRAADGSWNLPVEVTLANDGHATAKVQVQCILKNPEGNEFVLNAIDEGITEIAPFQTVCVKRNIPVSNPVLWSVDHPAVYSVHTTVRQDLQPIDEKTTTCGFRTIRFDPDKGFFLNDQPLKLKGVCNHQDSAGVGVAVPDSIWDWRIRKLKEIGANAYRCAHNPPAREFLDACDRLGLLVMDENRNFNTTDEYTRQLQWMIRRDRNHPSIILWSVFNEEPMQASWQGFEMVRRMTAEVKQLDSTRPVTAAQSWGTLEPINASLAADVCGFNYHLYEYDQYHKLHPDKPITSSEDTSTVMTRGYYGPTDHAKCLIASYDEDAMPWGNTHRAAWAAIEKRPFIAGGFVWTGFDYRGEPQPLLWPAASSSFGILDLCGFPKSAFYLHQAEWLVDKPVLQIVPHWNWTGSEGKPIKVMVFSNGQSVELSLNGKSLGSKPVDSDHVATWSVPYEPGKLEAVATSDGKEQARNVVETTGGATALQLIPDRDAVKGDREDAVPVTVQAVDAAGRVVPDASQLIHFEIDGPAAIIGLGNGDPTCHEPEKGNQRSLFHGLAQVIIQSDSNSPGPIRLTASADNLTSAQVIIQTTSAPLRPEWPAAKPGKPATTRP